MWAAEMTAMPDDKLRIIVEVQLVENRYRATRHFSSLPKPRNANNLQLHPHSKFPIRGEQRALSEPLDILIHYLGDDKPANFDFFFDERGQFDLGIYFYQQLFQRLSREERASLDDAECVDLVIVTRDPHIARLPWVLLVRNDRFVATSDWTIALGRNADRLSQTVELPPSPKILVIAPNPKTSTYPDTYADDHIDELEAVLRGRDPLLARGERLLVATTWQAFRQELTKQPDVLYYYGHGAGNEETARLVFPRDSGGAQEIPVAEFAHCVQQIEPRPLVAYINCCHGDAGGALGAGSQLGQLVAAVVSNRTVAFTAQARAQAKRFLEQTLLFGVDPHEAVRNLYGLIDEPAFTLSNPRWMTPVCYRGYGTWKSTAVRDAHWILDPYWREKLDREIPFGVVHTKTTQMLTSGNPLGLAFLWYGRDGDGMELFHHRLNVELGPLLPDGVRLLEYRLHWPPEFADPTGSFDPNRSFREMYCHTFEVNDLRDVPTRVKRKAGAGARKTLVYLRHRVVRDPRSLKSQFLKAYLLWWDSHIEVLCGVGQYCLLGISYQSADPDRFARVIAEKVQPETLPYEHGVCRLLPRFSQVEQSHLLDFVRTHKVPLPAEGRDSVLREILRQTGGSYDKVIEELESLMRQGYRAIIEPDADEQSETGDLL